MAANTSNYLKFSEDFEADAGSLLEAACRLGLEGVIGKRADSPYVSTRSPTWIKLKCTQRQEFVIGGYTDPKGTRTGIAHCCWAYTICGPLNLEQCRHRLR